MMNIKGRFKRLQPFTLLDVEGFLVLCSCIWAVMVWKRKTAYLNGVKKRIVDYSLHFQTDDGLRKNISQNDVHKREKKGIEHDISGEAGPAKPNAERIAYLSGLYKIQAVI